MVAEVLPCGEQTLHEEGGLGRLVCMLETAGSPKVGMGDERVAQGHRGQLGQATGEVGRWQNMMAEKGQAAENAFELALGLC